MKIPIDVSRAIEDNKLVFFVGSGFSKTFNFPEWSDLVKNILEDLKSEDDKYEGLLAALEFFGPIDILEKINTHSVGNKRKVFETLRNTFKLTNDDTKKLDNHKLLGEISNKIITTNYDQALEKANPEFDLITYGHTFDLANINELDNYILKLHGCVSNVSSCVLFKEQYDELYKEGSSAIERLRTIISDHTIIFIGFSLTDPFVQRQFEYINSVYKGLGTTEQLIIY